MISLEDRQALARDIAVAHTAGARLKPACETVGIDMRTLQRWKTADGLISGDRRPQAVHPVPGHALCAAERAQVLAVANEPRFAAVPPARIVPMLADEGIYLASESTFSRILREHGQTAHRGRAKAPKAVRPPTTHIATEPRQVWCWDMTYLPAQVAGRWFYLYLILDLGACQDSCRLVHAAICLIFTSVKCVFMTESRSGFSVTVLMGAQFRVWPDQRAGFISRALRYKSCRAARMAWSSPA